MHTITPSASRPMTEIWRTTLIRFCGFRNELFGEKTASRTHIPRKMKTIRYLRMNAPIAPG